MGDHLLHLALQGALMTGLQKECFDRERHGRRINWTYMEINLALFRSETHAIYPSYRTVLRKNQYKARQKISIDETFCAVRCVNRVI
ncbi:hypothetical protein [Tateyamaria sp. ANG-S1]|uniref:hypothetical protein n=1 Tax=Tateyamaria sp. ANG-S1 TaxID=1577905 RepID=UPI00187BCC43|nr:hypothetical protein [Tateyamaria sp. ANG-S1]